MSETLFTLLHRHRAHAAPQHAEAPVRLEAIARELKAQAPLPATPLFSERRATRDELEAVHPPAYLDLLASFCETGGGWLDIDTYAQPESVSVAERACGSVLDLTDHVMTGRASNGIALVRPPGHHVRPAKAMGFGLLSTVAVAARYVQAAHGAERVLIVDMDAHHGNGTQEIFEADPDVVYFSSHQEDIFPGTGSAEETGAGAGEGATVNVPLPLGTGDAACLEAYRRLLLPLAARTQPDVVLVSAGFDAHARDPLAGLGLSVSGMMDLLRVTMEAAEVHAGGRLVAALEGGYTPDVLAACAVGALQVLNDPTADVEDPFGAPEVETPGVTERIDALRTLHRFV